MLNVTELNSQNEKIKEITKVLNYLILNKEMCSTETTCDLFMKYTEEVTDHLYQEEKEIYLHLLNHEDPKVKNTASDFFSGSIEIKRVFNEYLGRWCKQKMLRVNKHDDFVKDSQEVFDLVMSRVNAESDILYPIVKNVVTDKLAA